MEESLLADSSTCGCWCWVLGTLVESLKGGIAGVLQSGVFEGDGGAIVLKLQLEVRAMEDGERRQRKGLGDACLFCIG